MTTNSTKSGIKEANALISEYPAVDIGKGIQVSIESISPAQATEYLEHMGRNRKLNPQRANEYRQAMENDTWTLSPQAIAFDKDGKLIDGQHRCQAVIDYGKPVPFVIIRGFEPQIIANLDQGKARRAHETLTIALQQKITNRHSACLRLYLTPLNQGRAVKLNQSSIVDMYQTYQDAIDFAISNEARLISPVTAAIAKAYFECKDDEELLNRLNEFKTLVAKGQLERPVLPVDDSAAILLRNKIQEASTVSGGSIQMSWLRKSCHALRHFLDRHDLRQLSEVTREQFEYPTEA